MPPIRRPSHAPEPVPLPPPGLKDGAMASLRRTASGRSWVEWEALPAPQAPILQHPYAALERQTVLDTWAQAHTQRAAWLSDLPAAPAAAPAMTKDLAATPRTYYMRAFSNTGRTYVQQMTGIGQREGFAVVADTRPCDSLRPLHHGVHCRTLTEDLYFGELNEWCEDDGHVGADGSFNLPARLDDVADLNLKATVLADRRCRLRDLPADFAAHGAVQERRSQLLKVSTALAEGRTVRENLSHVEGGNVILGTRAPGTPYALVGRDSVAITRALLARQLERPVSQRSALAAIAKDLGLQAHQVYPVEQPNDFHVDMYMVAMAPGQVLLNDARWAAELAVAQQALEHLRARPLLAHARDEDSWRAALTCWNLQGECVRSQAEAWRKKAAGAVDYEGRAYQDLRAAGLQVVRVPGRFAKHNFLNGEGGTNPQGERFFVTQGGEPWQQALLADLYLRRIPTGLQRLYFLDPVASCDSLEDEGGLGCRATAEAFTPVAA